MMRLGPSFHQKMEGIPLPCLCQMMEMQKRDIRSLQNTSQISTCLPHVPRQSASDPEHSITKSPLTQITGLYCSVWGSETMQVPAKLSGALSSIA